MQLLDLVIVAVIAWFTFSAFSAGLIRESVTVVALVGGAILAGRFYGELAQDIEFLVADGTMRNFAAFIAIFAGIVVLGQVAAMTLRRVASLLMLGPFDRLGGAVFGLAKGVLLVEVLLVVASVFPVSLAFDGALERSKLAPVFLDGAPVVLRLLPDEFREALHPAETANAVDAMGATTR